MPLWIQKLNTMMRWGSFKEKSESIFARRLMCQETIIEEKVSLSSTINFVNINSIWAYFHIKGYITQGD